MRPFLTLFLPLLTSFATAATTATTTATTTTTAVPDGPLVFYAELFAANTNCNRTSGTVNAFVYSRGSCQNFAIPGTGSARVTYNARPKNLTLTGWTEAGCKGEAIPFGTVVGQCVPLNGTDITSWSD